MNYDLFDTETALSITPALNGGYLLTVVVPYKGYYILKIDDNLNPDLNFGINGGVLLETAAPLFSENTPYIASDGDIYYSNLLNEYNTDAIWKYLPSGAIDSSFADGGLFIQQHDEFISRQSVVMEIAGNKIYSIGWGEQLGDVLASGVIVNRLNIDGSLDVTYGNGGINLFEVGDLSQDIVVDATLDDDGKIFIGVNVDNRDAGILKLNSNGFPDSSFGTNGVAKIDLHTYDNVYDIDIQSDGKILMMGGSGNGFTSDHFVARFLPNGTLDAGFGVGGVTKIPTFDMSPGGGSIYVTVDGSITGIGPFINKSGSGFIGTFKLSSSGIIDYNYSANGTNFIALSDVEKLYGFLAIESGFLAVGETRTPFTRTPFESSFYYESDILLVKINSLGQMETDSLGESSYSFLSDIIVDAGVLGQSAMFLEDLHEQFVYSDGNLVSHTITYGSTKFDYSLIENLIMVAVRGDEFTNEFSREIFEVLPSLKDITYSDAVTLVGVDNIGQSILSVAGADGFYVL